MASGNLNNFTVPLGIAGASPSAQGLLFPKLAYRFIVQFVGFGTAVATTELTKQVVSFARPNLTMPEKTIDIYNSKVNYAGKPAWSTSELTLRDDMQGQVAALVGQQIQKQFDFANQASASSASDYKFTTVCQITDGGNGVEDPVILETWSLYGCFITAAKYSEAKYSDDEAMTIGLTLKFDNALQSPGGVGTFVGRTTGTIAL